MATKDQMIAAARGYASRFSAGDRQGWLDLFVEEPVLIEPADAAPRKGREHLAASFDATIGVGMAVAIEPVSVIPNGDDVAALLKIAMTSPAGERTEIEVIEIYTIAPDGRIAAMRAFLP